MTDTAGASGARASRAAGTAQGAGERVLSPGPRGGDAALDLTLRPRRLAEYIGQDKVKENLGIAIAAAAGRGDPLDHLLLYGPPGLGKTTLAQIISNELGVDRKSVV